MCDLNKIKFLDKIDEKVKSEITRFHLFRNLLSIDQTVLYITSDDKVFGYGHNSEGQLGLGHGRPVWEPKEVLKLRRKDIKKFIIGGDFILALSSDRKLYSWGDNSVGQLGRGFVSQDLDDLHLKPKVVEFFTDKKIVKVFCCKQHAAVVTEDNRVYAWGTNDQNQISEDNEEPVPTPKEILYSESEVKTISLSDHDFIYILTIDGKIFSSNELLPISSKLRIIDIIVFGDDSAYILLNNGCVEHCIEFSDNKSEHFTKVVIEETINELHKSCFRIMYAKSNNNIYELFGSEAIKLKPSDESYDKIQINHKTIEIESNLKKKVFIGSGAFGSVYKVRNGDDTYAIKEIGLPAWQTDIINKNSELDIMKLTKSKFVVNLIDYWTQKETKELIVFIKMEFCDYDLLQLIKEKDEATILPLLLDYMFCCEVFKELLECVQYLHTRSPPIIHRDIKPSNVLIKYHDNSGHIIKLCDFGLSKMQERNTQTNTSNIGTLKYRAPEAMGKKYNEKLDIFSLGIAMKDLFEKCLDHAEDKDATTLFILVISELVKSEIYPTSSTSTDETAVEYEIANECHVFYNLLIDLKLWQTSMVHGEPNERPSAFRIFQNMEKLSMLKNNINLDKYFRCIPIESEHKFLKFLDKIKT